MPQIDIRSIEGFQIGHATDAEHATGCTVILCEAGAVAGVDVRGGGPATRETDLLRPENMVERINAVMLSGGSAFGLDAASGAMEYLERRGVGFDTGIAAVPIVCGASLFDLGLGSADVRPDKEMGLRACGCAAMPNEDDEMEGNVGAGTGCSVAKMLGMEHACKSGIGISAVDMDGLKIGAVVATNAAGNIIAEDGSILAGTSDEQGRPLSHEQLLLEMGKAYGSFSDPSDAVKNTTIGCIITNAALTKAQCTKLASMAHDGLAHAINPVHTTNDGDTLFVMSCGEIEMPLDALGIAATNLVEGAIRRAVRTAKSAYGLPGLAG